MTSREIRKLAIYHMGLWLSSDWGFKWSRSERYLGQCDWENKEIWISKVNKIESEDHVLDTILHEIGHALQGMDEDHHSPKWAKIVIQLGAMPVTHKYSSTEVLDWRKASEEFLIT